MENFFYFILRRPLEEKSKKFPAFFSALFFLLGAFGAFGSWIAIIFFLLSFLCLPQIKQVFFFFFALFFTAFSMQLPSQECCGEGIFKITSVKEGKRGGYVYFGILKEFHSQGRQQANNIKVSIHSKQSYSPLSEYRIKGSLKKKKNITFKATSWEVEKKTIYPIPFRGFCKSKAKAFIQTHYSSPLVSDFFCGMTLGSLDEAQLRIDFQRLGISHLLAISGFHFALIAFFLKKALFFIPYKTRLFFLLLFLNIYTLFLGGSPSVMRANLMLSLFFVAPLIHKKSSGLNSLGIALIVELLFDPSACLNLSFQLSFLATAALLLLVNPIECILEGWIPKKSQNEMLKIGKGLQCFYILQSHLRTLLAASLAVHMILTPLLLSTFHTISWHSIFHNLYLPLVFGLALFLFFFACILTPISSFFHFLTEKWTESLLTYCENTTLLSKSLVVEEFFPAYTALCVFSLVLLACLFTKKTSLDIYGK